MSLPTIAFLDNDQRQLASQQFHLAGIPHRIFEFGHSISVTDDPMSPISQDGAKAVKRFLENRKHQVGSIIVTNGMGAGLITAERSVPHEMRHLVLVISHDEVDSNTSRLYSMIGITHFARKSKKSEEPDIITIKDFCGEFAKGLTLKDCCPERVISRIKSSRE